MHEPFKLGITVAHPEDIDLNEEHEAILPRIAEVLHSAGHTVTHISLSHGSLRGGTKTWIPEESEHAQATAVAPK